MCAWSSLQRLVATASLCFFKLSLVSQKRVVSGVFKHISLHIQSAWYLIGVDSNYSSAATPVLSVTILRAS